MSKTRIGVGLLGFGVVGSGLYELLREEQNVIESRYGFEFDIRKILVRNPDAPRSVALPRELLASNFEEIISDDSVDVVIEVMGGETPAREYISEALKAGKHVITANKKLMGSQGEQLVAKARQHSQFFGYSAAITGCHQLCPSIINSVLAKSLVGIFNSTSNYILTKMTEESMSFEDALGEAQRQGYAEADPSEDVDGLDTRNKLVIVSRLALGVSLKLQDIPVTGIRNVTKADMDFAKQFGYTIKLVGISKILPDGQIDARVHPAFVPLSDPLANVKDVYNGIQVHDSLGGIQAMSAVGAGARPTAMAIFRDLISLAQGAKIIWPSTKPIGKTHKSHKFSSMGEYYLRLEVRNQPGVLAGISKTLASQGININQVIQHDDIESIPSLHVPLVIMCGPTQERSLLRALDEMGKMDSINSTPRYIRVEDEFFAERFIPLSEAA